MVTSEAKRAYMKVYCQVNKEKMIARSAAWRKTNLEAANAHHKTYRTTHKEKELARVFAWRARNPEYAKQYLRENKEKIAAYHKTYREAHRGANPGKKNARTARRRAAKIQRTPNWLTVDDYHAIRTLYETAAALTKSTGIKHHVDHIIPLQGRTVSGFHCPTNLQILTQSENCSKHNKFTGDE